MCHLSRGLRTLPLPVIPRHRDCGRKRIAVNEVESNPCVRCNLTDGRFEGMLRDFTSHQPRRVSSRFFYKFPFLSRSQVLRALLAIFFQIQFFLAQLSASLLVNTEYKLDIEHLCNILCILDITPYYINQS